MKLIPLTRGKFASVDDKYFDWLNQWKWSFDGGYARRAIQVSGKHIKIYMHRLLMGFPSETVDHINRNKIDNREDNLRVCGQQKNCSNSPKKKNNSSGYMGVSFDKSMRGWEAYIHPNRKKIHLGYFSDKESAAKARDVAAIKYFGEYANLNFPENKCAE